MSHREAVCLDIGDRTTELVIASIRPCSHVASDIIQRLHITTNHQLQRQRTQTPLLHHYREISLQHPRGFHAIIVCFEIGRFIFPTVNFTNCQCCYELNTLTNLNFAVSMHSIFYHSRRVILPSDRVSPGNVHIANIVTFLLKPLRVLRQTITRNYF